MLSPRFFESPPRVGDRRAAHRLHHRARIGVGLAQESLQRLVNRRGVALDQHDIVDRRHAPVGNHRLVVLTHRQRGDALPPGDHAQFLGGGARLDDVQVRFVRQDRRDARRHRHAPPGPVRMVGPEQDMPHAQRREEPDRRGGVRARPRGGVRLHPEVEHAVVRVTQNMRDTLRSAEFGHLFRGGGACGGGVRAGSLEFAPERLEFDGARKDAQPLRGPHDPDEIVAARVPGIQQNQQADAAEFVA